jgi:phosphohistidine phosphatase SixA
MMVILVRHAERVSSGEDPGLSAAGKRRAGVLATMLADADVSAIFTSTFRRTKETAAPLAQKTGLAPRVIDDDVATAKTEIIGGGSRVVVIGHSDTVPEFIHALGGPSDVQIEDDEFDRMFVLSRSASGAASLLRMRYLGA